MDEKEMTGSEILLKSLEKHNVDLIFGYPGGAVLPIYDTLFDASIPNILTRHEQGAVHAAEGYAKTSGKPGVVIVTSGPGATNAVTGIADAMGDSVPLIVITGQVGIPGIGKDAFQEADILGITLPITKHNYQVRDVGDIEKVMDEAFHIATTGRKGPVVIDMPKDISSSKARWENRHKPVNLISYQPNTKPSHLQLKKVMNQLKEARRPVVLVGAGVMAAGGAADFRHFIDRYPIPVVSTLLGLGTLPADHAAFLGMGGMHGSYASNMALAECDFLLNIGSRFDDRLATCPADFASHAVIAHIDIDPAEIGKIIPTEIPIVADAKRALQGLLKFESFELSDKEWLELCQNRKKTHPFTYDESDEEIKPQRAIEKIGQITQGEAYVITDVGQHQMWAAQFYPVKHPDQFVTSGGLGTMGYGIPAGIGVQFAHPDKQVVVFVGDGGFQMTNQEFAILNQYQLNIKFVLLNNKSLGMVRQWQETFHGGRRSASVFKEQPDFIKLAEAYGIKGVKLTDPKTFDADIEAAFAVAGPELIEVAVSPGEHVLPMVPAGVANHLMIGVD